MNNATMMNALIALMIADTAVEFTEFQQRIEKHIDTLTNDPMTFTHHTLYNDCCCRQ